MKKIFLMLFFVFICGIFYACDRTQSIQDLYKETSSQKETGEIKKTEEVEEVKWISLNTSYLNENEMSIMLKSVTKDDIKVKVLDAFYSDSVEAGGDYFINSKWMQERIESWKNREKKKLLFIKMEIENISEKILSYCVGNIDIYACKAEKDSVKVCGINIDSEVAFDASEDEEGSDYYYISLPSGEKRTFTVAIIVDEDLLIDNIENIYIDASMDFLDFGGEGKFVGVGPSFKLLHVPAIRKA